MTPLQVDILVFYFTPCGMWGGFVESAVFLETVQTVEV